jgi:hypothetical protein
VVYNITDEGKLERQERAIGQDKLLLLHRSPLPTLEQAISELLSAETRLGTLKSQHLDTVLATHQSRGSPSVQRSDSCRYCHSPDHALLHCPIRVCIVSTVTRLGQATIRMTVQGATLVILGPKVDTTNLAIGLSPRLHLVLLLPRAEPILFLKSLFSEMFLSKCGLIVGASILGVVRSYCPRCISISYGFDFLLV